MGVFASVSGGEPPVDDGKLNILVFGAHPDDCDLRFGGTAMKYRALGHRVKFVSMTNGDTGHYCEGGGALAKRRYAEAQASGRIADVEYEVMDVHNGELEPTVLMRKWVIQIMRQFRADVVLCHRPNDYHPDHRAVGILVQDAAYTVTVPNVAPLTPHLDRAPVVGHLYDNFKLPNPYVPTVAIGTDEVMERKIDMVHCHASQMYEWLPFNGGQLDEVPQNDADRRAWLAKRMYSRFEALADDVRDCLVKWYGEERGKAIRTAESVSISQYGRIPSEGELRELFPFFD
ncbi:MAG: PIG-L family deacetylase [Armatimonadetes bacterium]|nr:PIG-L family deacetylase [Armatimonadota bacterium]